MGKDSAVPSSGGAGEDAAKRGAGERPASLTDAIAASQALPPWMSARGVPTVLHWIVFALVVAGLVYGGYRAPVMMLTGLKVFVWSLFFVIVCWRFGLAFAGWMGRLSPDKRPELEDIDEDLPVYSVLVPLRDEANMMAQLAASLGALDWPTDRLEILLLVEADDAATREAVQKAAFPPAARLLSVPPGQPLTKPRALNFGLSRARGDYIVIYDAEDRPHPGQLRAAHAALASGGGWAAAVQAPLYASNGAGSWIAAHWALEYRVQFGLVIPALARIGHPVMLGGTSNHFRRTSLLAAGGWDAWNVTEDADLGVRFARLGGAVRSIGAPTYEAAPETYGVWFRQRTRWIKGFMQTWLVCMRRPFSLIGELGAMRWISLQLTLMGAILSAFLYGPMTLLVLLGLLFPQLGPEVVSFALFGLGWASGALTEVLAPGRWSFSRCLAILSRPLYWPLQTFAALNAFYGLLIKPSFWAKTPHWPDASDETPAWPPGSSRFPSSPPSRA